MCIVPTTTRWNSYYDAVVRVTNNSLAELNEVCTKLELQCFSEHELNFLKEYVIVLKPFKITGHFAKITVLETIIKKVVALRPDLSSMTFGLAGAIEDAIRHHFEKVFQKDKAILAAPSLNSIG